MLYGDVLQKISFTVKKFSLDSLNADVEKIENFISVVEGLPQTVDYLSPAEEWDQLCQAHEQAVSNAVGEASQSVPHNVMQKFREFCTSFEEAKALRLREIAECTQSVRDLTEKLSLAEAAAKQSIKEEFEQIKATVLAFVGTSDKSTVEYRDFTDAVQAFEQLGEAEEMEHLTTQVEALADEISNTVCTEENSAALQAKLEGFKAEAEQLKAKFSSGRWDIQLRELSASLDRCAAELTEYNEDFDLLREVRAVINRIMEATEVDDSFEEILRRARRKVGVLSREKHAESDIIAKLDAAEALVQTFNTVLELNYAIEDYLAAEVGSTERKNFKQKINEMLANLPAASKRLVNLDDFRRGEEAERRHAAEARRRERRSRSAKSRIRFVDWLKVGWLFIVVAGACVGAYFMVQQPWYFTASNWLFNHDINLWTWHSWGSGDWGFTGLAWGSQDFFLWNILLSALAGIADLLIAALQAVWYILILILWPVRWLLSQAAGWLLFGLAFAWFGAVAVACVVVQWMWPFRWAPRHFTYGPDSDGGELAIWIVQSLLTVGVAVICYLVLFEVISIVPIGF